MAEVKGERAIVLAANPRANIRQPISRNQRVVDINGSVIGGQGGTRPPLAYMRGSPLRLLMAMVEPGGEDICTRCSSPR